MTDYFAFMGLPRAFFPDEQSLRNRFVENSRRWHPDVHADGLPASREKADELSSLNNQAFSTLRDFDKRVHHLLALEGFLPEEGQAQLPQDFLMEMMDVNEELMELAMEDDPDKRQAISSRLDVMEEELLESVKPIMADYDRDGSGNLREVSDYLLKRRYFQRLRSRIAGGPE